MFRQSAYNAVPFAQAFAAQDDRDCPIYSPTRMLPMFQVEVDGPVSGAVDVDLEDYDGQVFASIPGIEVYSADNSKTYITYPGDELATPAPEGLYRVRISGDEISTIYLSHVLCLSRRFNPQDWEPDISCDDSDGLVFTVSFDEHPGLPTEIHVNYDNGDGWERIGDESGEIDASLAVSNSVAMRLSVWIDDALFYKEYTFAFDPDDPDPCGSGLLTFINTGGQGFERFMCLEWQNTNDLQTLGLMYAGVQGQNGFLQQFYFEGWASLAATATEETFLKNGLGESVLDSLEIARLHNVQFYGLPDACIAPIRAANAHNVRNLRYVADGWNVQLSSIALTAEPVDGASCSKGTLTVEANRALVGCQDNLNVAP